jgi:hypothetical protein
VYFADARSAVGFFSASSAASTENHVPVKTHLLAHVQSSARHHFLMVAPTHSADRRASEFTVPIDATFASQPHPAHAPAEASPGNLQVFQSVGPG